MNILKKINKMRIDRGWSIYRLSVESGIPQSTLTNMFNRETLPSITTLECICNAFGITMAEFFTEENNPTVEISDNEIISLLQELNGESKLLILSLIRQLSKKE
ncbi:MAG: helix-turn-helix transcriptional regulator [Clostridia bacterium]|nr:helix-turn-helix transcriptional regulator [Clostridia bacterium]